MAGTDLLSPARCRELFDLVLRSAESKGVKDVELAIVGSTEALTRFANNRIHQNVAERSATLSVRVIIDQRTARATTNRLDRDGVQAAVDEAVALARSSEPDAELLPLYTDAAVAEIPNRFSEAAARCTPENRAAGVAECIRIIEGRGQTAAGIYATNASAEALLNSTGLFRYYAETLTRFSVTAMGADSSGWAKASSAVHEEVRPIELAERASRKAHDSRQPRRIDPGRYTVVLEPAAVLDLVGQIFGDFSATALHDQRSFLNSRMGQRLFAENINIYDQVSHPMQCGAPYDGEGVGRNSLALVKEGVPTEVAYSRTAARRAGIAPTGHGFPLPNETGEAPMNIVIAGGTASLEELIASTANGILVTRLWYIREVEPYEKVMTGMTRDGTFLIRNGEIAGGLQNLRFNQSVVELLRNVEAMTPSVRATGEEVFDMVVPAMKIHDFHFTEVTTF
jgi:predicted Zn-dependent protease